jgi:hypothetical protein
MEIKIVGFRKRQVPLYLLFVMAFFLQNAIAAAHDHNCYYAGCCPSGYSLSKGTNASDNLYTRIGGSCCLVGLDGDDVLQGGCSTQNGNY